VFEIKEDYRESSWWMEAAEHAWSISVIEGMFEGNRRLVEWGAYYC
jgi:hypothetical protein